MSFGKANLALAAAIALLLLCSCATYFTFARMRSSQNWIQHTRQVQSTLDEVGKTITRAARLRTEYIASGDPQLLQHHADLVVQVRNAVTAVQNLTADNSRQRANGIRLADLTEQRIALLDRSIALKKSQKDDAEAQAAFSRQNIALADALDELLQVMYNEEEGLLAQRQQREQSFFTATVGTLSTGLFFALVLFLVHHQLLTEQVQQRSRAETTQRALSARLLTLQDEERRRFARELHDSVGQHLAAIKMGISMMERKLPSDAVVQDCLKLLDEAITETRTISHLLHPPLLDEAGLNSACRWFVEGFGKRSGIEVRLDIDESGERLSEAIELVLFRVLQESLTNVHRHAGATKAAIDLRIVGRNAVLRVSDNGRGISAALLQRLRDEGAGSSVGLAGMTERIREIGGELEINSSIHGTEMIAKVPARYRPLSQMISPPTAQEVQG